MCITIFYYIRLFLSFTDNLMNKYNFELLSFSFNNYSFNVFSPFRPLQIRSTYNTSIKCVFKFYVLKFYIYGNLNVN